MVINGLTMPLCGRRGGVSSLLDVVNRRVIAKTSFPGSKYGSFLGVILDGVDVPFPRESEAEREEKVKEKAVVPEKRSKKEKDPTREKCNLKESYKRARKESIDDVQKALRNTLVAKMRKMREDAADDSSVIHEDVEVEVEAMRRIVGSGSHDWLEELMRLWGLPGELGRIPQVLKKVEQGVEYIYNEWIVGKKQDERLWYMLGGGQNAKKEALEMLVKILLSRRASRLYTENLDAAVEVVLYAVNPDGFTRSYNLKEFREAELCKSLRLFERDGAYELALEALDPGRFSSLIEDVREVTRLQGGVIAAQRGLSRETLERYFESRDLLTPRATKALMSRHATGPQGRFTIRDFVRMYLALTDCSSLTGIRYWFAVLDHDQNGSIGVSDVAHYYSERRAEGERAASVILADVTSLWVRLCASARVDFSGEGIRLCDLKSMNGGDREFILCALLIRRLDDAALVNITATISQMPRKSSAMAVAVP